MEDEDTTSKASELQRKCMELNIALSDAEKKDVKLMQGKIALYLKDRNKLMIDTVHLTNKPNNKSPTASLSPSSETKSATVIGERSKFNNNIPIADVYVLNHNEKPLPHWLPCRLWSPSLSLTESQTLLHSLLGKNCRIYFEKNYTKPPITGICMVIKGEKVPANFTGCSKSCDVLLENNRKAEVYITRGDAIPLIDLCFASTTSSAFSLVDRSPWLEERCALLTVKERKKESEKPSSTGLFLGFKSDLREITALIEMERNDELDERKKEDEEPVSKRKGSLLSMLPIRPIKKTNSQGSEANALNASIASANRRWSMRTGSISNVEITENKFVPRLTKLFRSALGKLDVEAISMLSFDLEVVGLLYNAKQRNLSLLVSILLDVLRESSLNRLDSFETLESTREVEASAEMEHLCVFDVISFSLLSLQERGIQSLFVSIRSFFKKQLELSLPTEFHFGVVSSYSLLACLIKCGEEDKERRKENFACLFPLLNHTKSDDAVWREASAFPSPSALETLEVVIKKVANGPLSLQSAVELDLLLSQLPGLEGCRNHKMVLFSVCFFASFLACEGKEREMERNNAFAFLNLLLSSMEERGLNNVGVIAYFVRRVVFPLLLDLLREQREREELNKCIQILWTGYRLHLKVELNVYFHFYILNALKEGDDVALSMLSTLLDRERGFLLELYLNFDMLNKDSYYCLIERLCLLGEREKEESDVHPSGLLVSSLRQIVDLVATYEGVEERDREESDGLKENFDKAFELSKLNGAKSGVNYLIAVGIVQDSPQAVAHLLKSNVKNFGEKEIGEYLGEGGRTEVEQLFMAALRDSYFKHFFKDEEHSKGSFSNSLRLFLTKGGFALPGEAQKIERLLGSYSKAFVRQNPNFGTEDSCLILAFSVVMLNTDLHNSAINKKMKMRKEEFVKNLSGVNEGRDFNHAMLESLYDEIAKKEIKLNSRVDDERKKEAIEREKEEETKKERELLFSFSATFPSYNVKFSFSHCMRMFEKTSPLVFSFIAGVLERNVGESVLAHNALDCLEYALMICLFLRLDMEKRAFASLLAKLVFIHCKNATSIQILHGEHLTAQNWFLDFITYPKNKMEIGELIGKVHLLVEDVRQRVEKKNTMQHLTLISQRLSFPELCLEPDRNFIGEVVVGMKEKEREKEASLFLFSDCLIIAAPVSKLKLLYNLSLRTIRIFEQDAKTIELKAPSLSSSLFLLFPNPIEKKNWEAMVRQAQIELNLKQQQLERERMKNSSSVQLSELASTPSEGDFQKHLRRLKGIFKNATIDREKKLIIYGYFKQATKGDCKASSLSSLAHVDRIKVSAWMKLKGVSIEEARRNLIELIDAVRDDENA